MDINATMISLPIKDVDETIEYYFKNFHFEIRVAWPKENPTFILLSNENNHLGFSLSTQPIENNRETSINFDVNKIDDVYNSIKDSVNIIEPLANPEPNRKEFSLLDCNGYKVTLGEYMHDVKQSTDNKSHH